MVESNNWDCSLIDTPVVNGPRREIAHDFTDLVGFFEQIPGVADVLGVDEMDNTWTLHFDVLIGHELSSRVMKLLEDTINDMSLREGLPVSLPPVPIDFGDEERNHCMISSEDEKFTPKVFLKWIRPRLPNPISETGSWSRFRIKST